MAVVGTERSEPTLAYVADNPT